MSEYLDHLQVLSRTHQAVASELRGIHTLEKLLSWLQGRGLDFGTLDMVTQDEFCHDLIVPMDSREWLAFGMT